MRRRPSRRATAETPDVLRHLGDSLEAQWGCCCKNLRRCRHKLSRKAVHDSRVATRRLLSTGELLESFASKKVLRQIHAALKEYLDGFDEVRDTQVQLAGIGELKKKFPAAKAFHKWLTKREGRCIRKTSKAVRNFKTKRLARCIAALEKEIRHCREELPVERALATVLRSVNRAFMRVVEFRHRIKSDDTKTIHCTRIAFKHFRYMVEELSPLLPEITPARCQAMHDYQSKMGDIQDLEVLLQTFDDFNCRKEMNHVKTEQFRDELKRRQQWAIQKYLRDADALDNFRI